MSALAETIPQAVGDWTLRGLDVDQIFAQPRLSDDALTAACLTTARFDPSFPGWQLYRRVVAGFTMFDAELAEWAVGVAHVLATCRNRKTGRAYIPEWARINQRGAWIAEAAKDALRAVVDGEKLPETARALDLRIHRDAYRRIKHPVAAGMEIGLQTFRAELTSKYYFVRKTQFLDLNDSLGLDGDNCGARVLDFQSGNRLTPRAPNPDHL